MSCSPPTQGLNPPFAQHPRTPYAPATQALGGHLCRHQRRCHQGRRPQGPRCLRAGRPPLPGQGPEAGAPCCWQCCVPQRGHQVLPSSEEVKVLNKERKKPYAEVAAVCDENKSSTHEIVKKK